MKKFTSILWGLVFIVLGLIWGANSLGIADIDVFFNGWWTLFIIVPCFIGLFKDSNRTGNIIGLIIGLLLLLSMQGIISFDLIFRLAVPIVLIIIGISMIFNDAIHKNIAKKIKELNKNETEECYATFGEQKVKLPKEPFKGASLNAIFGSVKFDMTDAIIEKEQILNATSVFGGIDIVAPKNVNIKVKSTCIFGGVSNKIEETRDNNLPTVYINAFCMFGGVNIK